MRARGLFARKAEKARGLLLSHQAAREMLTIAYKCGKHGNPRPIPRDIFYNEIIFKLRREACHQSP